MPGLTVLKLREKFFSFSGDDCRKEHCTVQVYGTVYPVLYSVQSMERYTENCTVYSVLYSIQSIVQHIILKDGLLRFNSFNTPPRGIFHSTLPREYTD